MVDQRIACLTTDTSLILLFGDASQSAEGAGTDTGRLHTVLYPLIAAVALYHLAIGVPIPGGSKGAGHGTAFAADTVGIVVDGESRFRILAQAPHRAGWNARPIHAMHTCCGNICIVNTAVFQFHFIVIRFAEALIARHNICVVLVYTRSFEQEESHGLHT